MVFEFLTGGPQVGLATAFDLVGQLVRKANFVDSTHGDSR
jgi:hypothetical protein